MNIGERVGDYEIIQVLGTGGAGRVYKVRNVISERIEAMKILLPNAGSAPELADRFLREIKVQAALDHPNIARLYSARQIGDQLCMFMEFVEGQSLKQLLDAGPVNLRESLNFVEQILDALAYAHARGVVHRDIKPANIMCTPNRVVKLLDFGIARMTTDRHLTQTGLAVGSLHYMSPEQIQGEELDARSDLYSLGVTMYEMVTGRKPFEGTSDYSIMAAHLQQRPQAPIEVVPGVPPDLSDIMLMALAKDRAARFQNADAFRAALRNLDRPAGAGSAVPQTTILPSAFPPPMPSMPLVPAPALPPPISAFSQAPYAPPPPVPVASGSRRGLYMALGSIATLIILVIAGLEGPRLLRARAGDSAPLVTPVAPSSGAAEAAPAAIPVAPEAPVAQVPVPAPSPAYPAAPPTQLNARPQAGGIPPQPPVVSQAPNQVPPPVAAQAPPPTPPVSSPQPSASAAELNQLRQQYNQLSIRTSTASGGLRSLQQSMQQQGLNLRGDMLEAQNRMDYLMKEAMDSIRSGDAEQARENLQMAERTLATIEKFLGR